jgi:hypothetical protein
MIGSTRIRRIGVLVAGAALVLAAGCTVRGTTIIRAESYEELAACDPNNQYWVVGPEAIQVRFEVTSSDATLPLEGYGYHSGGQFSFGTVWDGTKSTGPKLVDLPEGYPWGQDVLVFIRRVDLEPFSQTTNVSWAFTALDANGRSAGFTCGGS